MSTTTPHTDAHRTGTSKEARRAHAEVLDATGDEVLAGEAAEMLDAAWDDIEAML